MTMMMKKQGWRGRIAALLCSAMAGLTALATGGAAAQSVDCPPKAAAPAAAAHDGRDRGLLWRLERGGRVSYLYGTLHVGRPAWAGLGKKLRDAFDASDLLAVELDVSNAELMQAFARALPVLPEFRPALAERIAAAAVAACGDPKALAALPPLLRVVTLALLPTLREGLDPAFGSEPLLLKAARDAKRPVVSLEDPVVQAQAITPQPPSDLEVHLLDLLDQMERGRTTVVMLRLVKAWEDGNAAELADYARWCECLDTERDRAWFSRINDQRNGELASRIDALHSAGQRVFAAIGALHMTGPEALPRLLAARGFVVQPVALQ